MEITHIEIPTIETSKLHYERLIKKYNNNEKEQETIKCPCGGEYIKKRKYAHETTRIHSNYVN